MRRILDLLADAGPIGIPLVLVSLALWAAIWLRALALRRGFAGPLEAALGLPLAPVSPLAEFIGRAARIEGEGATLRLAALRRRCRAKLATLRSVVRVLVATAPLLGLLGTVDGMVEMFASLHGTVAGSTVSGGISKALITTQLGLIMGAPGLVAGRLLERRELRLARELDDAHAAMRMARA